MAQYVVKNPASLTKSELVEIVRTMQMLLYAVEVDGFIPEEPEWDPNKEIDSAADFINGVSHELAGHDLDPREPLPQDWSPRRKRR